MSDWWLEPSQARQLAAWTKLGPDAFGNAYHEVRAAAGATPWASLALEPEAVLAACEEAERSGFLTQLAEKVAHAERLAGRPGDEIDAMFVVLGNRDRAQSVIDADMGFPGSSSYQALGAAMDASALVTVAGVPKGTAFLVRSDLVLTAAHVVLETEQVGNSVRFTDRLKPDIRFLFKSQGWTYDEAIAPAPPGRGHPVIALPHAMPPDELKTLTPDSVEALDFALVRLARLVGDIVPLSIDSPPRPRPEAMWLIGFQGGSRITFPSAKVESVRDEFGRILHSANSSGGMSGGCCLGPDGVPIALHEGSMVVRDARGIPKRRPQGDIERINRAVSLRSIRSLLAARTPDPLAARTRTPGLYFSDVPTLERWRSEARRLAGAELEAWDALVLDKLGFPPTGGRLPAFHPWFTRGTFETWVGNARQPTRQRLMYVGGDAGTGKSFAARIVAEKVGDAARDTLALTATMLTGWSFDDAVGRVADAAAAARDLRTETGAIRHDVVPFLVESLARVPGGTRSAADPMFISLDFERDPGPQTRSRLDNTPWLDLLLSLAGQDWARLVLIGLSVEEQEQLDRKLQGEPAAAQVIARDTTFKHIDTDDIKAFLETAFAAQGEEIGRRELAELLAPWKQGGLRGRVAELQTSEAVLSAMQLTRGLWEPELAADLAMEDAV